MSERQLERVIYVDDEPHIRALAKVSLEKVGNFTACLCGSGAEAVAVASDFRPDMILLDVMMPEMDGPTTLAALRQLTPLADVPIVFVTAKAQPSDLRRLREIGAADVIAKPFPPMELPGQLRAIWARASTAMAREFAPSA